MRWGLFPALNVSSLDKCPPRHKSSICFNEGHKIVHHSNWESTQLVNFSDLHLRENLSSFERYSVSSTYLVWVCHIISMDPTVITERGDDTAVTLAKVGPCLFETCSTSWNIHSICLFFLSQVFRKISEFRWPESRTSGYLSRRYCQRSK